jgi:Na+/melibiose symporter-like transporter
MLHHLLHLAAHQLEDYFEKEHRRKVAAEERKRIEEERRKKQEEEERKKLMEKKRYLEDPSNSIGCIWIGVISLLATTGCGYYCMVKSFNWLWVILCILGIIALWLTIVSFREFYSDKTAAKEIKKMSLEEFKKSRYNR